jgi:hypothetical protein
MFSSPAAPSTSKTTFPAVPKPRRSASRRGSGPNSSILSAIRGDYALPKELLDHAAQERRRQETQARRVREARRKEQQQAAAAS